MCTLFISQILTLCIINSDQTLFRPFLSPPRYLKYGSSFRQILCRVSEIFQKPDLVSRTVSAWLCCRHGAHWPLLSSGDRLTRLLDHRTVWHWWPYVADIFWRLRSNTFSTRHSLDSDCQGAFARVLALVPCLSHSVFMPRRPYGLSFGIYSFPTNLAP